MFMDDLSEDAKLTLTHYMGGMLVSISCIKELCAISYVFIYIF